ncbi:cytochrome ubiquinol oxidase subunit I [Acuticoccus sp. M5D2P5]|uniref:cytochrome ubiquinol oxidase subunit I n=1 Tax=Acuticoccus kalidii TaxID=2910977 RepID=UPI001F46474E|nr:cytochrome ubiquinol oxidase subunit I [Acuticoccus kalidii]MCF3933753.1 cytochrome ubiquinol oxidase subunit I [Acuticoccus kalidii]
MDLDPLLLSRIQFAFVITFHIIFPAFTIGLAAWLAVIEAMSMATKKPIYRRIFDFWRKIFAVSFGMGVVSGIVMAFQFGTNWSVLSERTGAIQGPLLGYEAFTAFILEATFFGVLMFGRTRVPPAFYLLSCVMVAFGTTLSSFWIMANNSWMQVPVGYEIIDDKIIPVDWVAIMGSYVFHIRWVHMILAAYLTTATVVAATGAWYLLRGVYEAEGRLQLRWGLALMAAVIPVQLLFGHLNGEYTEKYQPAKFTAIEGRWQTEQPARLILFAWPDPQNERNLFEIGIPKLGSFFDDGTLTAEEPGIVTIAPEDRPPLAIPFFGFRIMVGMGVVMLLIGWGGVLLWATGRLYRSTWFLVGTFLSFPTGFVAVVAGWYTAEVGRQPWVVYGLLRTADAHTPSITGSEVLTSLLIYAVVYVCVFSFGIYYIYHLLREGPEDVTVEDIPNATGNRPLAGAGDAESATGSGEDIARAGPAGAAAQSFVGAAGPAKE